MPEVHINAFTKLIQINHMHKINLYTIWNTLHL